MGAQQRLKACPFCGASHIELDVKSESVRARCCKCGALGPPHHFSGADVQAGYAADLAAARSWNERVV